DRRETPDVLTVERRAAAFDADNAFHEARSNFGHEPAKWPAGGVRHDDWRTDLVQQHRAALSPHHVRRFRSGRNAAVNRWRRRWGWRRRTRHAAAARIAAALRRNH